MYQTNSNFTQTPGCNQAGQRGRAEDLLHSMRELGVAADAVTQWVHKRLVAICRQGLDQRFGQLLGTTKNTILPYFYD